MAAKSTASHPVLAWDTLGATISAGTSWFAVTMNEGEEPVRVRGREQLARAAVGLGRLLAGASAGTGGFYEFDDAGIVIYYENGLYGLEVAGSSLNITVQAAYDMYAWFEHVAGDSRVVVDNITIELCKPEDDGILVTLRDEPDCATLLVKRCELMRDLLLGAAASPCAFDGEPRDPVAVGDDGLMVELVPRDSGWFDLVHHLEGRPRQAITMARSTMVRLARTIDAALGGTMSQELMISPAG